tara:strand:- start:663 stop:932 length:270 start_codon:yes stop_codon:yes gene_type:complete
MIGLLVRHKLTNKIGVVVKKEQLPLGFPYSHEGKEVAYFPATQEDILSGEVRIDVHRYEEPHLCILWNDFERAQWVPLKDIEIFDKDKK